MPKKQQKEITSEANSVDSDAPEDGLGSRLRSIRESRGLSQAGIAARTKVIDYKGQGVSRTVIVGYEAGQTKPGAREIRLLCEALAVTPNWLIYGAETSHKTTQASTDAFLKRPTLSSALRLALAISALRSHERSAFTSLVLSMAGRELGDLRLSSIFALASSMTDPVFEEIKKMLPEESELRGQQDVSLEILMSALLEFGGVTTLGNKLKFDDDGNVVGGEWLYPETVK